MGKDLSGGEIKGGIRDANEDIASVRQDLLGLAKENRALGLKGDDRKEFLTGMTQNEFDTLHDIATALGERGTNALERILKEGFAEIEGTE